MKSNKWISIKDRLPELSIDLTDDFDDSPRVWKESEDVLVYSSVAGVMVAHASQIDACQLEWLTFNNELGHVTHWMPLPEPPKGV